MAYFAFAPTGGGLYTCERPPIVRLFDPEPELDSTEFFDSGAQCNADARRRLIPLGLVALVGTGLTIGNTVTARRSVGRSHCFGVAQVDRDGHFDPEQTHAEDT